MLKIKNLNKFDGKIYGNWSISTSDAGYGESKNNLSPHYCFTLTNRNHDVSAFIIDKESDGKSEAYPSRLYLHDYNNKIWNGIIELYHLKSPTDVDKIFNAVVAMLDREIVKLK